MAYVSESLINNTNSGSTSDRYDVKYDFENGVTVFKKDVSPKSNNNFTKQYMVIVSNNSKNIFIFDNATDRDNFWGTF